MSHGLVFFQKWLSTERKPSKVYTMESFMQIFFGNNDTRRLSFTYKLLFISESLSRNGYGSYLVKITFENQKLSEKICHTRSLLSKVTFEATLKKNFPL